MPRDLSPNWREPEFIDAIAEHGNGCIGGMLPYRDLTTVTVGKRLSEGGRFIAHVAGHLPDGSVWVSGYGPRFRLRVVVAERRAAA